MESIPPRIEMNFLRKIFLIESIEIGQVDQMPFPLYLSFSLWLFGFSVYIYIYIYFRFLLVLNSPSFAFSNAIEWSRLSSVLKRRINTIISREYRQIFLGELDCCFLIRHSINISSFHEPNCFPGTWHFSPNIFIRPTIHFCCPYCCYRCFSESSVNYHFVLDCCSIAFILREGKREERKKQTTV